MLPTIQLTLCLQRGNQAPRSKRDPHGGPKFWDSHFRTPRPTQKNARSTDRFQRNATERPSLEPNRQNTEIVRRQQSLAQAPKRPTANRSCGGDYQQCRQASNTDFFHRQGYLNQPKPSNARKIHAPASIPHAPTCRKAANNGSEPSRRTFRAKRKTALPPQTDGNERKVVPSDGQPQLCRRC